MVSKPLEIFKALLALLLLISLSQNNHNIVDGEIVSHNGRCDIFKGKWVKDDSYPLYESNMCHFIQDQFDCRRKKRPDTDYSKYRWQPTGCDLPRFDGVEFLKKMEGKRLIFVGDSLSNNQWQSLTCLIHVALSEEKYILTRTGGLSNFTFPAYNVSVMFFRNAFLVDITHEEIGKVCRLDSISTSKIWGEMDVMIFDSWHWWLHHGRKQPWDWIGYGENLVKDMNRISAYENALETWAKWIDTNVDTNKSKVFFQGVSPDHDGISAKDCTGQTKLLQDPGSPHPAEVVVEKVLGKMKKQVYLLNVTRLSQLRVDGHPSAYGHGGRNFSDCTHWCLSGVPDIWNELFFHMLL